MCYANFRQACMSLILFIYLNEHIFSLSNDMYIICFSIHLNCTLISQLSMHMLTLVNISQLQLLFFQLGQESENLEHLFCKS